LYKDIRIITHNNKPLDTNHKGLLLFTGFIEMCYVIILSYSLKYAYNPGQAKAVITTSTIIIALVGSFVFKNGNLTIANWIGCWLIVIGVVLTSLLNSKGLFLTKT